MAGVYEQVVYVRTSLESTIKMLQGEEDFYSGLPFGTQSLKTLTTNITALQTLVDSVKGSASLNLTTTNLNKLQIAINGILDSLSLIRGVNANGINLTNLNGRVTALENNPAEIDVEAVQEIVDEAVGDLQTQHTQQQTAITTLQTQQTQHENDISALQTQHTADVNAIKGSATLDLTTTNLNRLNNNFNRCEFLHFDGIVVIDNATSRIGNLTYHELSTYADKVYFAVDERAINLGHKFGQWVGSDGKNWHYGFVIQQSGGYKGATQDNYNAGATGRAVRYECCGRYYTIVPASVAGYFELEMCDGVMEFLRSSVCNKWLDLQKYSGAWIGRMVADERVSGTMIEELIIKNQQRDLATGRQFFLDVLGNGKMARQQLTLHEGQRAGNTEPAPHYDLCRWYDSSKGNWSEWNLVTKPILHDSTQQDVIQ